MLSYKYTIHQWPVETIIAIHWWPVDGASLSLPSRQSGFVDPEPAKPTLEMGLIRDMIVVVSRALQKLLRSWGREDLVNNPPQYLCLTLDGATWEKYKWILSLCISSHFYFSWIAHTILCLLVCDLTGRICLFAHGTFVPDDNRCTWCLKASSSLRFASFLCSSSNTWLSSSSFWPSLHFTWNVLDRLNLVSCVTTSAILL